MVVFQSFRIGLLVLTLASGLARAGWLGPTINSIETTEDTAALDVVNQIRAEIDNSKNAPVALRIEVTDVELKSRPMKSMKVRDIPAMVALRYVAMQCSYEFLFEDGMWIVRDSPILERQSDDSRVTLHMPMCTTEELNALGLKADTEGVVTVSKGRAWPETGEALYIDGVLVVKAYQWEIDCLTSLLTLHKHGYKIPAINSDQSAAPESDPHGG
ncbi:MAG: hypothetical protein Q7Q71_06415 [Verrucomicrobiota bacterium JB023]|nr:hypothetical protein [Verrucomicrobiota bacterium JB023]